MFFSVFGAGDVLNRGSSPVLHKIYCVRVEIGGQEETAEVGAVQVSNG